MVSDWQGGDISKLFPALSGKEDLSMGEDKKADKKRKRIVPKAPVQMIISREYVGTQTVTEAFTIMSSLAQEESRSISENCTWGQRKRFANGKVTVPFKRFLGYDCGLDGNLVVNPEQAVTIKRIYSMFLQ